MLFGRLPDFVEMVHDIGWWTFGVELAFHEIHVWRHMTEELVITLAQVIEAWIAVAVVDKSVFWTFAVAGKLELALAALLWK